jgi:hypothetical protein
MSEIKFSRSPVKFSYSPPGGDRIYHVNAKDVCVVLGRLPEELWSRLRGVHFNDRSRGARRLGYVTGGRREITLCALPPRMSFRRFLFKGQTPEQFGAVRGKQWPLVAIRRFLLYDVFLHELGHLQLICEQRRSHRLRFADEKLAEEFAIKWYKRLWSEPFEHPDPVHNPPTQQELADASGVVSPLLCT